MLLPRLAADRLILGATAYGRVLTLRDDTLYRPNTKGGAR
jgi:hypothetical protein